MGAVHGKNAALCSGAVALTVALLWPQQKTFSLPIRQSTQRPVVALPQQDSVILGGLQQTSAV